MKLTPPVNSKDHSQGDVHAPVELVEYGDYQCPYCGMAYPIIKALQQKFGKDLRFVFRNFPLSKIHPQAKMAAVAAEAAGYQNKFWAMHDIIFENQRDLRTSSLIEYANRIGLNVVQFTSDLTNHALVKKVEDDFESGLRSGVNGTPGFFINGQKYSGNWDENNLAAHIKNEINLLA